MARWAVLFVCVLLGSVRAAVASEKNSTTNLLAWDAVSKTNLAKAGELISRFEFTATNLTDSEILVDQVTPSCGCTTARLPDHPWRLAPHGSGRVEFAVDLRLQHGVLFKTADVVVSNQAQTLVLNLVLPPGITNGAGTAVDDRIWNQELTKGDHQAPFHDNCVKCHLVPAFGKTGDYLYRVACGICHDSPRRATMVPDLHSLKQPRDGEYWKKWVTEGKEGTLMPGFAATIGGPLNTQQINSLVKYLLATYPAADPK